MNKVNTSGFALIEVLLSVFVVALAVIGAAGMQLTALRTTQQSGLHGTALHLATDMADRLRAGGMSAVAANTGIAFQSSDALPASPDCIIAAGICSAQQAATSELQQWLSRIRTELPNARVAICRDAKPWDTARHAYKWECDGAADASLVVKIGWQQKQPDGTLVRDANGAFAPAIALTVGPQPPQLPQLP